MSLCLYFVSTCIFQLLDHVISLPPPWSSSHHLAIVLINSFIIFINRCQYSCTVTVPSSLLLETLHMIDQVDGCCKPWCVDIGLVLVIFWGPVVDHTPVHKELCYLLLWQKPNLWMKLSICTLHVSLGFLLSSVRHIQRFLKNIQTLGKFHSFKWSGYGLSLIHI